MESFEEHGISDIGASYTIGAYGPRHLPANVRAQLATAFAEALKDAAFVDAAITPNSFIADGASGAAFEAYLARDRVMQKVRVQVSGAQLD